MELTIRAAEEADIPALSTLARRTWADAFGASLRPDQLAIELDETRSEDDFRAAFRADTILVAELDDDLVGYVQFGTGPSATRRRRKDLPRGLGRERAREASLRQPRVRTVGTTRFTLGGEAVEDLVLVLDRTA